MEVEEEEEEEEYNGLRGKKVLKCLKSFAGTLLVVERSARQPSRYLSLLTHLAIVLSLSSSSALPVHAKSDREIVYFIFIRSNIKIHTQP